MWSALPEIQRHTVTLRYRLSNNTPSATTVALTKSRKVEELLIYLKYSFLFVVHGRSNTPPVVTATVEAVRESGSIVT